MKKYIKMFIRKYGRKGEKGVHEEIIISQKERKSWSENSYVLIENKTRYVLDNLDRIPTFKVVSNRVYRRMQSEESTKKGKPYKEAVEIKG